MVPRGSNGFVGLDLRAVWPPWQGSPRAGHPAWTSAQADYAEHPRADPSIVKQDPILARLPLRRASQEA